MSWLWNRLWNWGERLEHDYLTCPRVARGYKCKGDYRVCRMD